MRNELTGHSFVRNVAGAIYAVPLPRARFEECGDPFEVDDTYLVVPPHVTERITRQSGLLTLHGRPTEAWVPPELHRLVIPLAHKNKIKHELATLGVHQASLFPDVNGIARHLGWQFKWNLVL